MGSRLEESRQRDHHCPEKQNLYIFLLAWCRFSRCQQRASMTVARCLLCEGGVKLDERQNDCQNTTCTVFVETFSGERVAVARNLCPQTSTRQNLDGAIRAQCTALSDSTFRLYRQPDGDYTAASLSTDLLLVDRGAVGVKLFKPLDQGGFGMRHNDAVFVVPTDLVSLKRQLQTVAGRYAYSAPGDAVAEFTRIFNVLMSCIHKIQTGIKRGPCASWGNFIYNGQVCALIAKYKQLQTTPVRLQCHDPSLASWAPLPMTRRFTCRRVNACFLMRA